MHSHRIKQLLKLSSAIVPIWIGLGAYGAAQAEAAAPAGAAPSASSSTLQELVVTAQRREQNLQDVPIAVTALSNNTLEAMGVQSVQQLTVAVPGLMMTEQHGGLAPFLRGVGTVGSTAAEEGSIPVYVDGVLLPNLSGAAFSFPNVERVEVLKGPQGTLFGRNSVGGLINVITRDPSHTTSGTAELRYGNYNTVTASAYATAGVTDDIAVDITAYTNQQGQSWGRNVNASLSGPIRSQQTDSQYDNETLVRTKLLYTPTSDLRVTLSAYYDNTENTVGLLRSLIAGTKGFGGGTKIGGYWDNQSDPQPDPHLEQWGGYARIEYNLPFAKLTSTTAFGREQQRFWFDQDAQVINVVAAPEQQHQRSWQQEFLLSNSTSHLDWTAGLYYFYTDSNYDSDIMSSIIPAINDRSTTEEFTKSYAAFAQATYRLDTGTSLTAGIRYTEDKRQLNALLVALPGNPAGAGTVLINRSYATDPTATLKKSEPTWRLAIDQKLTDDAMIYASYNRGFKSGIFSMTGTALNQPAVLPETIDAYELGLKSEFADKTVRLNLAGFYYDHANTQLTKSVLGAVINFNAPGSTNYGVDGQLDFAPRVSVGSLEFMVNAIYEQGHYKDFPGAPIGVPQPRGGDVFVPGNAKGNTTIRTPTFSGSISVSYEVPTAHGQVGANANYYYTSKFYWDVDNRLTEQYDIFNGEIFWVPNGSDWRFSVWGKNLGNSKYSVYSNEGGNGDEYSPAPPRTFGIAARLAFH